MWSADLFETFDDYDRIIRLNLGVAASTTNFLTDTASHDYIRLAVATVVPTVRADKQLYNDTTVYLQSTYTLDSLIIGVLSIRWVSKDSTKVLKYLPSEQWSEDIAQPLKDNEKSFYRRPQYYDFTDDQLILFPTPIQGGDSLLILGWRRIPSISAVDSLSTIPQNYRVAVLHYATWLIARDNQRSDVVLYRQAFTDAINLLQPQIKDEQ